MMRPARVPAPAYCERLLSPCVEEVIIGAYTTEADAERAIISYTIAATERTTPLLVARNTTIAQTYTGMLKKKGVSADFVQKAVSQECRRGNAAVATHRSLTNLLKHYDPKAHIDTAQYSKVILAGIDPYTAMNRLAGMRQTLAPETRLFVPLAAPSTVLVRWVARALSKTQPPLKPPASPHRFQPRDWAAGEPSSPDAADWLAAECKTQDVRRFFEPGNTLPKYVRRACARCVLKDPCLAEGLETDIEPGNTLVWGGLMRAARETLARHILRGDELGAALHVESMRHNLRA